MFKNGANRNLNRRRLPRSLNQSRGKKKSSDGGRLLIVDPHPHPFVMFPWFSMIVRVDSPPANFTSVNLHNAFLSQTGLSAGSLITLAFRLQHFKVWGALVSGTTTLNPVTALVFDPIGAQLTSAIGGVGQRVLEQLQDWPDQVSRAALGYHYPKAQREFSFTTGAATGIPILNLAGVGGDSVLYFYVQWRVSPVITPTVDGYVLA
jgi:hypothetical protein